MLDTFRRMLLRKIIKSIIWILALLLILLMYYSLYAQAESVTLEWDAPETPHDGVRIFQKTAREGDEYDYFAPIAVVPSTVHKVTLDIPGEMDAVLKYSWVARAYRGNVESVDSNEVSYKIVNIPPASPIELAGSYDYSASLIQLEWVQPEDQWYGASHWIVYYRIGEGEYIPIDTVRQGQDLMLETPFTAVGIGDQAEVRFVVVAYRSSGVYSSNSQELVLNIDRRDLPPIQNLRMSVEIHVQ